VILKIVKLFYRCSDQLERTRIVTTGCQISETKCIFLEWPIETHDMFPIDDAILGRLIFESL
jgi:hypothetical protein